MINPISPELQAYVNSKISGGTFGSETEFVSEAVRLYRDVEQRHLQLKQQIADRIAEADQQESQPLDIAAIKVELVAGQDDGELS